jgi:DNA polymerase III delta' subunit
MSFSRVQDQAVAMRLLSSIIRKGRIPSGLLLWGPDGVGKRLAAFEMAKAVNCLDLQGDACDTCLSCRKAISGNHPDIKMVAPAGKARLIVVKTVDDINETTAFRPFEGRRRIFIIEEADRMNEAAQNHFLKTLEEPASPTLFVLVTSHPRALLPTVRSRCQSVRFGSLRVETVADLLVRQRGVDPATAGAAAALSQGQMSRALDLVESDRRKMVLEVIDRLRRGEDPLLVGEWFSAYLQKVEAAITAAVKAGPDTDDDTETSGEESRDGRRGKEEVEAEVAGRMRKERYELVYLFQAWYRDVLVYATTGDASRVMNRDRISDLTPAPGANHAAKLEALDTAWLYLERNLNPGRVFRDLFFALAG